MANSNSLRSPKFYAWAENQLIRRRWWVFGLLWLVLVLVELYALPLILSVPSMIEISEFILFAIPIAVVTLLLEMLARAITAKNQAADLVELKHKLSAQLASAKDWDDLVEMIVAACSSVITLDNVILLVPDPQSDRVEAVAQWKAFPETNVQHAVDLPADFNFASSDCVPDNLHPIRASTSDAESAEPEKAEGYNLPLMLENTLIAKLVLFLPPGCSLTAAQAFVLKNISSNIATSVVIVQQRQEQVAHSIDLAKAEQRRRLAQDLHDTLGQKLVYLRLKLDQLSSDSTSIQLSDVLPDLEQMRRVADESCELVRGTLAVLDDEGSVSLLELFLNYSKALVARSKLKLTFDETGEPLALPPGAIGQIFYVFGEALSNVERHAQAQKVAVKLEWGDKELVIKVIDNGKGFESTAIPPKGHYGLTIMRERIEALGGHFDIRSAPGQGTRLTIRLAVDVRQGVQRDRPNGATVPKSVLQ